VEYFLIYAFPCSRHSGMLQNLTRLPLRGQCRVCMQFRATHRLPVSSLGQKPEGYLKTVGKVTSDKMGVKRLREPFLSPEYYLKRMLHRLKAGWRPLPGSGRGLLRVQESTSNFLTPPHPSLLPPSGEKGQKQNSRGDFFWFPRSRVGIHTSIDTLIRVFVPTQERGNERLIILTGQQ